MARMIIPGMPNPNNFYRDEVSKLGDIRSIYTGPTPMSMPRVVTTPNTGQSITTRGRGMTAGSQPIDFKGRLKPPTQVQDWNNPNPGMNYAPSNSGQPISNTYPQQQSPVQMKASQDYDRMMQMYQGLLNRTPGSTVRERLKPPAPPEIIQPESFNYSEDPRLTDAISGLEDLTETGGYSSEDISNLRERGISPIRAVYANAQRGLDRQKNLSGGYSPNYGAVSAKMAREMSDLISGKVTDVNAGIAEQVAQNKLQSAPQLANLLAQLSGEKNRVGERNVEAKNRANETNALNRLRAQESGNANLLRERELDMNEESGDINQILQTLQGMQSLFGANNQQANQFADNIFQGRELDLRGQQLNQQGGLALIDAFLRGRGRG